MATGRVSFPLTGSVRVRGRRRQVVSERHALPVTAQQRAPEPTVESIHSSCLSCVGVSIAPRARVCSNPRPAYCRPGHPGPVAGWVGLGVRFPVEAFVRALELPDQHQVVLRAERGLSLSYEVECDWLRGRRFPVAVGPGRFERLRATGARASRYPFVNRHSFRRVLAPPSSAPGSAPQPSSRCSRR